MAITASTNNYDAILSDDNNLKSVFEQALNFVNSSSSWVQGDNLCIDATSHCLRAVTSDADGATFAGVAQQSVTAGILVGPYPTGMATISSQQSQQLVGPAYGCVVSRTIHAADALYPGVKLFLPATGDTQNLTITDAAGAGDFVGIYMGPVVASAVAGTLYPVKIGYKNGTGTTLQF
jgi:hypothetical protein